MVPYIPFFGGEMDRDANEPVSDIGQPGDVEAVDVSEAQGGSFGMSGLLGRLPGHWIRPPVRPSRPSVPSKKPTASAISRRLSGAVRLRKKREEMKKIKKV